MGTQRDRDEEIGTVDWDAIKGKAIDVPMATTKVAECAWLREAVERTDQPAKDGDG